MPINNKGNNEIRELKWGFDLNLKRPIINAGSETVFNKKSFRDSFFSRRCIMPVSSSYEWEKIDNNFLNKLTIEHGQFITKQGSIF